MEELAGELAGAMQVRNRGYREATMRQALSQYEEKRTRKRRIRSDR